LGDHANEPPAASVALETNEVARRCANIEGAVPLAPGARSS